MNLFFYIIDWILYLWFAVQVLYLLVYSLASRWGKPLKPASAIGYRRIAVLIAAYREDAVIRDTVEACLRQDYPREMYDVVVISDHMSSETNAALAALPVILLRVDFEQSTNTKSLRAALEHLGDNAYDVALVVDADNFMPSSFLSDVNDAFAEPDVRVVQTHRMAKNLNTDMAYLDAMSEEMNNSIFRLGHANLGMSAALIGSGMAFEYGLFYHTMMENASVGGFDRVLELKLLYQGVFFRYLPDTCILDEKIQRPRYFYHQRRRWLAAQYDSFSTFLPYLLPAIRSRKWDFCDKLFQQASLSRVLLLGFIFLIALAFSFFVLSFAWKWWGLLALLLLALGIAIPGRFWRWRMLRAVCLVPYSFLLMFLNLFRLKEAKRRFIHTAHGVK